MSKTGEGAAAPGSKLEGVKVMVTRPEPQAHGLRRLIENQGGTALDFPVIEIKPCTDRAAAIKILERIEQYDLGIFVSANAVDGCLNLLGKRTSALKKLGLIAIGPATARALTPFVSEPVTVNDGLDSETLLAMDALKPAAVSGKKIIILRGEGGRELLAATLRARGAEVDYAEVYRRACPSYECAFIRQLWAENTPDVVIISSKHGLQNLIALLDQEQRALLQTRQLLVVGARMSTFALQFGFQAPPLIAPSSSDGAICETLVEWTRTKTGACSPRK